MVPVRTALPGSHQTSATSALNRAGFVTARQASWCFARCASDRQAPLLCLVHHAVAQCADAGNLDLHGIAGLHPQRRLANEADAFRGAGGNDVAEVERQQHREIGDDGGYVEDQVVGQGALDFRAVKAGAQGKFRWIAN
jgi:hypothetical protein